MENNINALARSRIALIASAIKQETDDTIIRRLRSGEFEGDVVLDKNLSNAPLSLLELTTWNTWFYLHPQKQAGITKYATSREFPVQIVGDKKTILETLDKGISDAKRKITSSFPLLKIKAKALKVKIEIEIELQKRQKPETIKFYGRRADKWNNKFPTT